MPLLVLCPENDAEAQDEIYEAGASEVLRLDAPPARLLPRLHHLVRQQRYRQTMLDVYREGRHYAATDALTGLYGHAICTPICKNRSRNAAAATRIWPWAFSTLWT